MNVSRTSSLQPAGVRYVGLGNMADGEVVTNGLRHSGQVCQENGI